MIFTVHEHLIGEPMFPHSRAFMELSDAIAYAISCADQWVQDSDSPDDYSIEVDDDGAYVRCGEDGEFAVEFEVFGMEL